MANKNPFGQLKKAMASSDSNREKNITLSRELTKRSKEAIYLVHRDELKKASSILIEVKKKLKRLPEIGFSPAHEEYVEASLFLNFVKTRKITSYSSLKVNPENYVGGLSDLTGELARRVVLLAIKKKIKEIQLIRDAVDMIHGELLKINFRNGELRRKYDSIKWNLEKIEKVLYEVKS